MINDKSQGQGSITKHFRCNVLLYYKFIIKFAGKRISKINEHLAKLRTKWMIASFTPFASRFSLNDAELAT